jgi:hypothetical protein
MSLKHGCCICWFQEIDEMLCLFANLNNLEMFRTQFGAKFILKVLPKYVFKNNSPK